MSSAPHPIHKKIVAFAVAKSEHRTKVSDDPPAPEQTRMHERLPRPEVLPGATYKIKAPTQEHAFYITINDIVLDAGTPFERRRPFEMFINSKNMEHFQWIAALTLLVSAVFRKSDDVSFLVEELRGVFDPRGGYFKPGHGLVPSIIAEIGMALEHHLTELGVMQSTAPHHAVGGDAASATTTTTPAGGGEFPPHARWCSKCNTKALVVMDGCETCLSCGYSKCG